MVIDKIMPLGQPLNEYLIKKVQGNSTHYLFRLFRTAEIAGVRGVGTSVISILLFSAWPQVSKDRSGIMLPVFIFITLVAASFIWFVASQGARRTKWTIENSILKTDRLEIPISSIEQVIYDATPSPRLVLQRKDSSKVVIYRPGVLLDTTVVKKALQKIAPDLTKEILNFANTTGSSKG